MNAATSLVVNAVRAHPELSSWPAKMVKGVRVGYATSGRAYRAARQELAAALLRAVHSGVALAVQDSPAGHLARELAQLTCGLVVDWDQVAAALLDELLDGEAAAPLLSDVDAPPPLLLAESNARADLPPI